MWVQDTYLGRYSKTPVMKHVSTFNNSFLKIHNFVQQLDQKPEGVPGSCNSITT
jgi:hypothetical protein